MNKKKKKEHHSNTFRRGNLFSCYAEQTLNQSELRPKLEISHKLYCSHMTPMTELNSLYVCEELVIFGANFQQLCSV